MAVITFSFTIALGALLLFAIQPLFARMVLPILGGAPAVWTTAMVFFQATLLAGYLYAHLSTRFLNIRWQLALHIALLIAVFFWLPVAVVDGVNVPTGADPIAWLLLLCTTSIGIPFFVVSSTAPLTQRWFSYLNHPDRDDPYFLYSASNAGALVALLAYPTLIEPLLSLKSQGWFWSIGFSLLTAGLITCGIYAWKSVARGKSPLMQKDHQADQPFLGTDISWRSRLYWVALSFIPSAMLLGVTLHISTDVAAAPFLWIAPLAIFILSFILVFARRPLFSQKKMLSLQAYAYVALAVYYSALDLWFLLGLHFVVLFATAMVCHGRLAQVRPGSEHLTQYYLWISLGGVLGGIFSAVIAPLIFDSALEYPLAVIGACLLRPFVASGSSTRERWLDVLLPVLLVVIYLSPEFIDELSPGRLGLIGPLIFFVILMLALLQFQSRPLRFTLGIAFILFGLQFVSDQGQVLLRERSFYGIYGVEESEDGSTRTLAHGTTIHGAQATDPRYSTLPLTYYNREGPLGQVFRKMNYQGRIKDVGAVGLGVGTIACYAQPGQSLTFYEIDPAMVEIASNPDYFRFLSDCGATVDIVVGDGRLMLAQEPDEKYDLLVLDAFSSDAIPVHLLTREAFAVYFSKLRAGGILMVHVSNRYIDLKPVIADVANAAGSQAWLQSYSPDTKAARRGGFASDWILVSTSADAVSKLNLGDAWIKLNPSDTARPWSDDYANLINALDWGKILWTR